MVVVTEVVTGCGGVSGRCVGAATCTNCYLSVVVDLHGDDSTAGFQQCHVYEEMSGYFQ